MSAALPRSRHLDRFSREKSRCFGVFCAKTRRIAADGKHVPRYCFKYGVPLFLAMFGLLQLWQASGDGEIPTFHVLHLSSGLDLFRNSHPHCVFADTIDSYSVAGFDVGLGDSCRSESLSLLAGFTRLVRAAS